MTTSIATERLLLGAGPSGVPERVLAALARPTVGHLDPAFDAVIRRTAHGLRTAFNTTNPTTLPLSGTGSAAMDAIAANFVEPGDELICGIAGLFGERMADALQRAGAHVTRVEASAWGRAIPTEMLLADADAVAATAIFVVHAETSTGVRQSLEGLGEWCRDHDALLLVDCVSSLSGLPVDVDEHAIDVAFSATQKCLACPPGLAPFTVGPRALERFARRTEPVRSWYFDLGLLSDYWLGASGSGGARAYHHTAPINMVYALDEALTLVDEEGLEPRFNRHVRAHRALRAACSALGLEALAPESDQLPSLLALRVGDIDEFVIRQRLYGEHGIAISGGLGPLAGEVVRIGVMGEGARPEPQRRLIGALARILDADPGDPLMALDDGWRT